MKWSDHENINGIGLAQNHDEWVVKINLIEEFEDLRASVNGVKIVTKIIGKN